MKSRWRGGGMPRKTMTAQDLKTLPGRDLPGATMTERLQALEELFPDGVSRRELAGFLARENERAFLRFQENDLEGLGQECSELFWALRNRYGASGAVLMSRHGSYLEDAAARWMERGTEPGELSEERLAVVHRLALYIMGLQARRTCTFFLGSLTGHRVVSLPREIPPEEREEKFRQLEDAIREAMRLEGSLILRYASGFPGKEFLNGFRFERDRVVKVRAKKLRWAQETQPDGSRHPDPTAIYREADVDLR